MDQASFEVRGDQTARPAAGINKHTVPPTTLFLPVGQSYLLPKRPNRIISKVFDDGRVGPGMHRTHRARYESNRYC